MESFHRSFYRVFDPVREGEIPKVFEKLLDELDAVGRKIKEAENAKCGSCYMNLEKELKHQMKNLERISGKILGLSLYPFLTLMNL